MTAREDAREAVVRACQDVSTGDYELADAASDVWEPLLREALDALRCVRTATGPTYPIEEPTLLELRLAEALG